MDLLAHQIEQNRDDLVSRYLSVLRESLFTGRAELRPSALNQIASDEADALLSFLRQPGFSAAGRGEQLHQAGLTVGALLRLSQVARQFLLNHLADHQFAFMLEVVDAYGMATIEGFVQGIDNANKIERSKLERVLNSLHQRGDV